MERGKNYIYIISPKCNIITSAPVVVVDDQKELTELKDLKATYQTLLDEHEATLVLIKKLEGENKKGMEEINSLLKDKAVLSDVNAKLKIAQEKITTITAEKTKLEGYLRTAKSVSESNSSICTNGD